MYYSISAPYRAQLGNLYVSREIVHYEQVVCVASICRGLSGSLERMRGSFTFVHSLTHALHFNTRPLLWRLSPGDQSAWLEHSLSSLQQPPSDPYFFCIFCVFLFLTPFGVSLWEMPQRDLLWKLR